MTHYFISDIHLDEKDPAVCDAFFNFIEKLTPEKPETLYILGDLFEVWIGDDHVTLLTQKVIRVLSALEKNGTKIFFMPGNRDFLIGQHFLKQCHATLLPDPQVIYLNGKAIILTHGDLLCTDDKYYQRFRYFIRQPLLHWLYYRLPLKWRQGIANHLRQSSKKYQKNITDSMMDVTQASVEQLFNRYNTDFMIHGHTHKPAIHHNKDKTRVVLAAWHDGGNHLKIKAEPSFHFELINGI